MKYWVLTELCLLLAVPSRAAMVGSYAIGDGRGFATIQAAFDSLMAQGISGDVNFKIMPGVYTGPLEVGTISGTGAFSVRLLSGGDGWVTVLSTDTTRPTLTVAGTASLLFTKFEIESAGGNQPALRIAGSSRDIKFTKCKFTGSTGANIVECLGSECVNITIERGTIRRGTIGVLASSTEASSSGLRIENCAIDSVSCGVYLSYQTNVDIKGCEIRPNLASNIGTSGIWVEGQLATDSVQISGNKLYDMRATAGYACGIRYEPWSAARLVATNNFIYGFNNTGSSQVRAIFFSSGDNRIVNNSIYVNDVAATGSAYSIYNGLTSAAYSLELKNNILFNAEATRPAYNLFVLTQAAPLISDRNIFYGTGADYQAAWLLGDYVTLSSWQAASTQDAHSVNGNPQFISTGDLHLLTSSNLAHQNGAVALDVTTDIDGGERHQPPDIGADEYEFAAPPLDAALLDVIGLCPSIPEMSLVTIRAVVQNRGSSLLTNVPIRLTLSGQILTEVLTTLPPSHADTVIMVWSTGAAQDSSPMSVEVVVNGDANSADNLHSCFLTITGPPMSGSYRVGGIGADFSTISSAIHDLQTRGMSADVSLDIASGIYAEPVILTSIPGSDQHSLTVRRAIDAEGPVQLNPSSSQQILRLSGISHVTLEGFDIQGGANTLEAMRLDSGASFNTIRNCNVLCSSLEQTSAAGIYVLGGCKGNTFEDLSISNSFYGVRIEGNAPQSDSGNVLINCQIQNVRTGIYLARQRACKVERCTIAAGFENAPSSCYAVRVGALTSQDTVRVTRNNIMGGESSGTFYGISSSAGAGTVVVDNNFFGDWTLTGSGYLYCLHVLSGQIYSAFNSFDLNEISGSATMIGVYGGGTSASVNVVNSIIRISESQNPSYALLLPSGTIHADHNLFEAPSGNAAFALGRIGSTTYSTLDTWRASTHQDSNSVSGFAGFFSLTDLHIRPDAASASNSGTQTSAYAVDIDGEARDVAPDLGADEYVHVAAVIDASCTMLNVPESPLPANSSRLISGAVHNAGTVVISNAQVELFYNGTSLGQQIVSISPGNDAQCDWMFATPATDLSYGSFVLTVTATGDVVPQNNELMQSIVIAGAPLSGNAFVSPLDGQFATPNQLVEHLRWRGVEGEFIATIESGEYSGPLELHEIPFADASSRVILLPVSASDSVIFDAMGTTSALKFLGADRVEVRGIFIRNELSSLPAVTFEQSSMDNHLVMCSIQGAFPSDVASVGIRVGESCGGNVLDSCNVSGFYTGITLTGDSTQNSVGNRIEHTTVTGARFCVWADHQSNAVIAHCDLQPGRPDGIASSCYGVYAVQLGQGGSLRVEGNRIHGFRDALGPTTNRACGIYAAPGGDNVVEIVNNFIYDYSAIANNKVRGIYLATGANLIANNSIRLDNAPTTNDICGIYCLTGVLHSIYNNCVVSYESNVASRALYFTSTSGATADYNCYWGSSALFSCAVVDTHAYTSLASWRTTGHDTHGNNAHPQYVSSTDLHIETDNTALYRIGVSLPEVPTDIDGDMRFNPPCIGADEYLYQLPQLPAPDSLVILAGQNTVRLFWTPVAGASAYEIFTATTPSALDSVTTSFAQTTDTLWILDLSGDSVATRFFRVDTIEP